MGRKKKKHKHAASPDGAAAAATHNLGSCLQRPVIRQLFVLSLPEVKKLTFREKEEISHVVAVNSLASAGSGITVQDSPYEKFGFLRAPP